MVNQVSGAPQADGLSPSGSSLQAVSPVPASIPSAVQYCDGLGHCLKRTTRRVDGEALARRFHEIYERLAPDFGYETRTETRDFDPTSPNGRLMIAVCTEIGGAQ